MTTALAARLTEVHRVGQLRLGALLTRQMLAVWPALDPEDLDATTTRWLTVAMPLVQAQRAQSTALAASYLTTFRALHLGLDPNYQPALAGPADPRALATSLTVTGPIRLRSLMARAVPLGRATDLAGAGSARAAMRHTLDGGRETVTTSVERDDKAIGWARVTSGDPCFFCAVIASNGPHFGTEDSASFEAHDGCACEAEPVYSEDQPWPGQADQYRELWQSTTGGLSGNDAINAFRQAFTDAA